MSCVFIFNFCLASRLRVISPLVPIRDTGTGHHRGPGANKTAAQSVVVVVVSQRVPHYLPAPYNLSDFVQQLSCDRAVLFFLK